MLGAIYYVSHRLWLCVLFHAMINAFLQVWVNSQSIQNPFVSTCISAIFKIAVAIIIVVIYKKIIKKQKL